MRPSRLAPCSCDGIRLFRRLLPVLVRGGGALGARVGAGSQRRLGTSLAQSLPRLRGVVET